MSIILDCFDAMMIDDDLVLLPVGHVWIGNYSKIEILKALWTRAKIASFYPNNGINPPTWNDDIASAALDNGYIDYLLGRCFKMKITQSSTSIDTRMYDRSSSVPAAQTIASLMNQSDND
jgi:hypothetical protein